VNNISTAYNNQIHSATHNTVTQVIHVIQELFYTVFCKVLLIVSSIALAYPMDLGSCVFSSVGIHWLKLRYLEESKNGGGCMKYTTPDVNIYVWGVLGTLFRFLCIRQKLLLKNTVPCISFFVTSTCHIPKLSYWTCNLAIDIVVPLSQVGMSLPSLW